MRKYHSKLYRIFSAFTQKDSNKKRTGLFNLKSAPIDELRKESEIYERTILEKRATEVQSE